MPTPAAKKDVVVAEEKKPEEKKIEEKKTEEKKTEEKKAIVVDEKKPDDKKAVVVEEKKAASVVPVAAPLPDDKNPADISITTTTTVVEEKKPAVTTRTSDDKASASTTKTTTATITTVTDNFVISKPVGIFSDYKAVGSTNLILNKDVVTNFVGKTIFKARVQHVCAHFDFSEC